MGNSSLFGHVYAVRERQQQQKTEIKSLTDEEILYHPMTPVFTLFIAV